MSLDYFDLGIGLGVGLAVTALASSVPIGMYLEGQKAIKREELEKAKIERGLVIQERNVIGSDISDKFYEIDGKQVYLEIDGKPIEQYFK